MKPNFSRLFTFTPVSAATLMSMAIVGTVCAQTWTGLGGDDLWGTAANWGGTAPVPGATTDISFAGATRLTPDNNYTAFDDFRNILVSSGASSFTLGGSAIDLFGKIENNSANAQTVNLSIGTGSTTGSFIEMDPVSGNLHIGGSDIFLGNNQLRVWGNNGKTLSFGTGTVISGTGGSFSLNQNSVVLFQSAHTYSGDTFVNAGRLDLASGSSLANSQIQLGDTTGTVAAELRLTRNGGYDFNRNITVRAGSSGAKTISSTNTSGTNIISGTVTLNSPNVSIKASAGASLTLSAPLAGTTNGGLIVGDAGTVNLTGGGVVGGGTGNYFSVQSGTLNISNASLTVSPGYRLNVGWTNTVPGFMNITGTTATLTTGTEINIGGGYNGSQTTGTGTISISGTPANPGVFSTGTTAGNLTLGVLSTATGSGTLNLNAYGTLETSRSITSKGLANSAKVNFDGGSLKLTAAQPAMFGTGVVTTINSGGATIDTQGHAGTIGVNLLAGSGTGGLTKLGTGALTLSGTASTFTGVIDLQKGTLAYNSSGALGSGTAAIKLAAGTILKPNATSSITRAIHAAGVDAQINTQSGATATFTGGFAIASGFTPATNQAVKIESVGTTVFSGTAINLPGMQVNKGQAGTMELNVAGNHYNRFWNYGGTVKTGVAGALDPDAQFDNRTNGSVLNLNGTNQTVASLVGSASDGLNSIVTSATAATLTISPASGSFTYAGNFTGNLGITKEGAGTQILSAGATHTYTGATIVNAGTLVINGNISTSSGIDLNGGALGGSGTVGNVTLDSGSLAPGNSIGTLNANELTWNGGLMSFELDNTNNTSDWLNLSGGFLKGSGATFVFNFLGTGMDGQTYTLVNFASSTFAATDFSYSNLNTGLSGTFGLSGSSLTFTVVPEPRAALLGGLGIIALLRRRRN